MVSLKLAWTDVGDTEATVSVVLVLAFVPLQKFPTDLKILPWKCPLQNENGLVLFKTKLRPVKVSLIKTEFVPTYWELIHIGL